MQKEQGLLRNQDSGFCYRLNVCKTPTPRFIYWNLIPSVMILGSKAFGRLSGKESEALMNGASALILKGPRELLSPSIM